MRGRRSLDLRVRLGSLTQDYNTAQGLEMRGNDLIRD